MHFIFKGNTKNTTEWHLQNVSCFNKLRSHNMLPYYTEGSVARFGTFTCEPLTPRQHPTVMDCFKWDLRVFHKAKRVLPILKHVQYEKVFLTSAEHPRISADFTDRWLHIVTVPSEGIPADEALTAIFIARDLLNGDFRINFAKIFGGARVGKYDSHHTPLLPGFNPNKFWGNNKYFTAVVYFLLAFQPARSCGSVFGEEKLIRPRLNETTRDGFYWTNCRTSLYSILRFAKPDGYNFVQPSVREQTGYTRDSTYMEDMAPDNPSRLAVAAPAIRYGTLENESNYLSPLATQEPVMVYAISNLLTEGEKREYFERGHRYAIENFITNIWQTEWEMTSKDVLDLMQHLVDIQTNDQIEE